MTVFRPFAALRYSETSALNDLIAPPYDVLSAADRMALEDRHPHNSVRIDFPHGADDPGAYTGARSMLDAWLAEGVIGIDADPSFSIYRMIATDESGTTRQTTGVIGGLGLEPPGTGDVLPHEETTSKDKADRLNLIRATEINTSPIWGLSLTSGLGALLESLTTKYPVLAEGTDEEGVVHQVWRVDQADDVAAIQSLAEKTPVVIADGHHRFETGLAYLSERGTNPGESTGIMALLVELAEDQLVVRAIHRLVELPEGTSVDGLVDGLSAFFDIAPAAPVGPSVVDEMAAGGFLTLVSPNGTRTLTPKPEAFDEAVNLDSTRVRVALAAAAPDATVRYQHSINSVTNQVNDGLASVGILLRPATVNQIRAVADSRTRMPAKTTFFWPKPRTGIVYRSVR